MQQELIEWSKTILLCQSIMPRLVGAITKENEKMMTLGYGSRHYDVGQSTYDFLEKMLSINIKKRNLVELSHNVSHILKDMDKTERNMLEERFFSKKSVGELMPRMNIRTTYRRYNSALEHFSTALIEYGYNVDTLEDMFGDDRVISAILERVKKRAVIFTRDSHSHKKRAERNTHIATTSNDISNTRCINTDVDMPMSRMCNIGVVEDVRIMA